MRKLVTAVLALGLMAAVNINAFAAFSSLAKVTNSASVALTAAGVVNMTLTLKRLDNNNTTNQIFWDPSGISVGVTEWRRADAYIVLSTTMTTDVGAVQIYTDNAVVGASPRYTGSADANGLVCAEDTTKALKMAWRATDISTTTLTIQHTPDYANLYVSEIPNYYCFHYMKDAQGTDPITNGETYSRVKEFAQGNHLAESAPNWSYVPNINQTYLYLGANFGSATTPHSYKTSKLVVETYLQ
jgi:hypothetical protein